MTDQHPIVPSFELTNQWHKEACKDPYNGGTFMESKTLKYIATKAAQWGADQELEACCGEVSFWGSTGMAKKLCDARRPKPPSLKELALALINSNKPYLDDTATDTIRRALEALPND